MKVAIVGSRSWPDPERVREYVRSLPAGTVVVTGAWDNGASIRATAGVDRMAYQAALEFGLVPVLVVANPHFHGWKAAGPRRNPTIIDLADRVVAFDAGTPGTAHSKRLAQAAGKPLEVILSAGRWCGCGDRMKPDELEMCSRCKP